MSAPARLGFLLATFAAALGLSACGGGSVTSTGGGGTVSVGSAPASASAVPGAAKAGRAAPFVRAGADNSIPTFGREAPAAARSNVSTSLGAYLEARAAREWGKACAGLARSLAAQLPGMAGSGGCPAAYAALSHGQTVGDTLNGPVLSLRIRGRQGFALWIGPGGQQYVMPLSREGSAWRPTQPAPLAYPLGSPVVGSGG
jgi:hypothetical protein